MGKNKSTELAIQEPLILPEYVTVCPMCKGEGEYPQTYTAGCGGGYYKTLGKCDYCDGMRYRYKGSFREGGGPVTSSVLAQITYLNNLTQPLERVPY